MLASEAARSLRDSVLPWHAAQALQEGQPSFYLGCWIRDSHEKAYMASFRPLEQLTTEGWSKLGGGRA